MNFVTHACAPVVVALAVDVIRLHSGRNRLFSKKHLIAIGLAGILPDLLNLDSEVKVHCFAPNQLN